MPVRLSVSGRDVLDASGRPIVLRGVNMYMEWYKDYYGRATQDFVRMRQLLPSANFIRLIGLLWKDSTHEADGLECSNNNATAGYFSPMCLRYLDAMVRQATEAGFYVVLTARAKYAAGWAWPNTPDVFHNGQLRQQMLDLWGFIARRYRNVDRLVGYEIMSEPRSKSVSQSTVRDFMADGCTAVQRADPHALCVVGPAPYYKLWELGSFGKLPHQNVMCARVSL